MSPDGSGIPRNFGDKTDSGTGFGRSGNLAAPKRKITAYFAIDAISSFYGCR